MLVNIALWGVLLIITIWRDLVGDGIHDLGQILLFNLGKDGSSSSSLLSITAYLLGIISLSGAVVDLGCS